MHYLIIIINAHIFNLSYLDKDLNLKMVPSTAVTYRSIKPLLNQNNFDFLLFIYKCFIKKLTFFE